MGKAIFIFCVGFGSLGMFVWLADGNHALMAWPFLGIEIYCVIALTMPRRSRWSR